MFYILKVLFHNRYAVYSILGCLVVCNIIHIDYKREVLQDENCKFCKVNFIMSLLLIFDIYLWPVSRLKESK